MMSCSCANAFAVDKPPPDAALLEYLGSSVRVGKDLVDPMSLQTMQDGTTQPKKMGMHDKSAKASSSSAQDKKHRRPGHE